MKTFLDFLSELDDPSEDPDANDQAALPQNVTNMRARAAKMNANAREKIAREQGDKFGVQIARRDAQRASLTKKRDDFQRREARKNGVKV
jgi:hypothetical protein